MHIPISVISVILHYEQLCRAPTSVNDGICFWYFATLKFESFSTKVCLRFHRWWFISAGTEFFSWTYLLKKTPRRTKLLTSPVWNKILKLWDTLFDLIQIEVQCTKNYFKFFLSEEARASGSNIDKKLVWRKQYRYKIFRFCFLKKCFAVKSETRLFHQNFLERDMTYWREVVNRVCSGRDINSLLCHPQPVSYLGR